MVDVLIFVDFEAGHVFPTLKMAQNLKSYGFKVAYMGIADTMEIVKDAGFDSYEVFTDIYPKGSFAKTDPRTFVSSQKIGQHLMSMMQGDLQDLLNRIQPRVLITSFFLRVEALILAYRYSVNQMIYWPFMYRLDNPDKSHVGDIPGLTATSCARRIFKVVPIEKRLQMLEWLKSIGIRLDSFMDVGMPLSRLHHIVLCPKELEIAEKYIDNRVTYLGPGIREPQGTEEQIQYASFHQDTGKPLIYVSMGSQLHTYPEKAHTFFRMAIAIMERNETAGYHMIIAAGRCADKLLTEELPENVSVVDWVPQTVVLQQSAAAVIHGGLGSIKECIYYGVPMLVVPMGRDQYSNAQRVVYHQLGYEVKAEDIGAETLKTHLLDLIHNEEIRSAVKRMQLIFQEKEAEQAEVELIERITDKVVS